MKKLLTLVLAITMVLSMTVMYASAYKGNDSLGEVPVTDGVPTIDGVQDAIYQSSLVIDVNAPLNAIFNSSGDDYAIGKACVLVSADYSKLYVYAQITDNDMVFGDITDTSLSTEVDGNNKAAWCHDGFEIFIDPTNEHSVEITIDDDGYPIYNAEQRNSGLYQYRQELNGTKSSWANGGTTSDTLNSTFEAATKIYNATTYATEFAIDLTALKTSSGVDCCKEFAEMGFQMMINDKLSTSDLGYNTLSSLDGSCSLNYYGGTKANSPCVWASQDWLSIKLGNKATKPSDPVPAPIDGPLSNALGTADTIATAVGILVLAAAGAVAMTKKKR